MSLLFEVPAQFLTAVKEGDLVQKGALLKDVATGRIVAHMQESGAMQKILETGVSFDPTGISSLIGVAQTVAIVGKLNTMQSMIGTMQILEGFSLAASVIGMGVTAASTAMILSRLAQVDKELGRIEVSIAEFPVNLRELNLREKLVKLRTSLERLQEAEVRPDRANIVLAEEARLNYLFDEIHDGLMEVAKQARINPDLVRTLLASLMLCGSAQIKSLFWLDMKEAAEIRSCRQVSNLQDLSFLMPRDRLVNLLENDKAEDVALSISEELSQIRMRIASQPSLARTLIAREINGREYVEHVEQEAEEPYLF